MTNEIDGIPVLWHIITALFLYVLYLSLVWLLSSGRSRKTRHVRTPLQATTLQVTSTFQRWLKCSRVPTLFSRVIRSDKH